MKQSLSVLFLLFFGFQLDAQDLATHDFEDGTLGDWTVCTTQNPNYVRAVNGRMKTWWTEVGYNGTRMDKGAEACADQIVYNKEGWYGMKVELGADYPDHTKGAIAQVFGFKPGFWSWSGLLEMIEGDLVVIHRRGGGGHTEAIIYEDFPNEREFSIIIHFVLSDNNAGMFQVWIDDVLTYDKQNINFGMGDFTNNDIQDVANGNYTVCKIGQYNHTDDEYIKGETRTVYYDNVSWYNGGAEGFDIVNPNSGNTACRNTTSKIEAECYDDMYGVKLEEGTEGTNLDFLVDGDWSSYSNIDLTGMNSVKARVASSTLGGDIEVRLGSETGALIATIPVQNTGGDQKWETVNVNIERTVGEQELYFVFKGDAGYLYNINWFGFSEEVSCSNTAAHIEAECYDDMLGIQTEGSSEGTKNIGWINDGDWTKYNDIDLTEMNSVETRVSGKTSGSIIEVRLDAPDGELITEISVSNTNGNQNWVTTDKVGMNAVSGIHDVYLVFRGEEGYLFNVNYLEFGESIVTATSGIFKNQEVTVFPNPFNNRITVSINNSIDNKVEVLSLLGEVIFKTNTSQETLEVDLNSFKSGVYMVRVTNENGVVTKEVLKN